QDGLVQNLDKKPIRPEPDPKLAPEQEAPEKKDLEIKEPSKDGPEKEIPKPKIDPVKKNDPPGVVMIRDSQQIHVPGHPLVALARTSKPRELLLAGNPVKLWHLDKGEIRVFGSVKSGQMAVLLAPTPDGKKFFAAALGDTVI